MTARVEVQVGERTVIVRELTVAEVRAWVAEHEAGVPVDPLRALVFDDCSLDDLARLCDLPVEEMEQHTVADLTPLRDKAKARQGAAFDLRRFHAEVLKDGSMPLDVLDHKIERWLAQPATATPAPAP